MVINNTVFGLEKSHQNSTFFLPLLYKRQTWVFLLCASDCTPVCFILVVSRDGHKPQLGGLCQFVCTAPQVPQVPLAHLPGPWLTQQLEHAPVLLFGCSTSPWWEHRFASPTSLSEWSSSQGGGAGESVPAADWWNSRGRGGGGRCR